MRIKQLRIKKNMTQKELAIEMGKAQSAVAMWESGKRQPRTETLPKLACVLGCTIDALYMDNDSADKPA